MHNTKPTLPFCGLIDMIIVFVSLYKKPQKENGADYYCGFN